MAVSLGGLEIVEASRDRISMVTDANLPALARQINSVLDRYEAKRTAAVGRSGDELGNRGPIKGFCRPSTRSFNPSF